MIGDGVTDMEACPPAVSFYIAIFFYTWFKILFCFDAQDMLKFDLVYENPTVCFKFFFWIVSAFIFLGVFILVALQSYTCLAPR